MFFAFISAFSNAVEVVSDKLILKERFVNFRNYLSISMTFIFLLTLVPFIFLGKIGLTVFNFKYILALAGIIIVAFFYNIFYFFALSHENACEIEPLAILAEPLTIVLAALFFPSERSFIPIAFTLIAIFALIISRVEKANLKKLKLNKYTLAMIGFIFTFALESQFVKVALEYFSPVAIYTFRTGVIAILFLLFLKPKFKSVNKTVYGQILLVEIVTTFEYLTRFYAIGALGVVKSSLIFLLGPVLILLFSTLFMKEKITLKKAIADAIIVLCIAAVYLFK